MTTESLPHSRRESPERAITDALVALRRDAPHPAAAGSIDRLFTLVYDELRVVAHRQLAAERPGHTLSTTALVHEAYLKLVDQRRARVDDRAQFFALAARAMRRILVDYARRRRAHRRGGGQPLLAFDDVGTDVLRVACRAEELLALDSALECLAAVDERLALVVECRFFAGLTDAETAAVLGVTPRTVARDWVKARGWLYRELRDDEC